MYVCMGVDGAVYVYAAVSFQLEKLAANLLLAISMLARHAGPPACLGVKLGRNMSRAENMSQAGLQDAPATSGWKGRLGC